MTFTLNVTTDRGAARGHTNTHHSTNFKLHYRYLPDILGCDGIVASPSIRPSALKGGTAGSHHWRSIIWLPGDNMLMLVTDKNYRRTENEQRGR